MNNGKKGDAPWFLLPSGINADTASVTSGASAGSPNGQPQSTGATLNGTPVSGMYFLHPDHLGSITMVTNAQGNPITGADFGTGASRIAYRPYGEIDRVNSDGPDITRFKYTGQVEDAESRLLYYKARYYDPQIGVFTSADSIVQPDSPSGMNRFAYVSGNPVNYRDSSGNSMSPSLQGAIIGYVVAPAFGLSREQGAAIGFGMGKNYESKHKDSGLQKAFNKSDLGKINGGKAWDTLVGKDGLAGWVNDKVIKPITKGISQELNRPENYDATKQGEKEALVIRVVAGECQKLQGKAKTQCENTFLQFTSINNYHRDHWKGHEPHDYEISYSPDEGILAGIPAPVIMYILHKYYYEP